MHILITGGRGFIGRNFVRYMHERYPEYKLYVLDKFTYAADPDYTWEQEHGIGVMYGDISDQSLVNVISQTYKFDAIINFAAESHVDRSLVDIEPFLKSNVHGPVTLARAFPDVKKFVQVSTDEVYGSISMGLAMENREPLRPGNPYAASKASAELFLMSLHNTYNLPLVITRGANTYGPWQFPEKMIPLFITNALEDKPLPIYGTGRNIRDWLDVRDHCYGIDQALHNGKVGHTYNIIGDQSYSNIDIAKMILKQVDKSERLITFVQDRAGHDFRYAMSGSKIRQWYQPMYKLENEIGSLVQWYKNNDSWWKAIKSGTAWNRWEQSNYRPKELME